MRSRIAAILAFAAGCLLAAAPLMAHHSFAAEYDSNQPVTVKGVVSKVAWMNPHAYVWVDSVDESGAKVTWAFETLSPNALARSGWNRNSLKEGDQITVEGFRAKDPTPLDDGSLHGNGRSFILADGTRVFSGTAGDGGPESATARGK